jgi:hypothetical protein
MASTNRKVQVYADLAEWEHQHGSPQARDRFLILAADAALTAGLTDEAEQFRGRLLETNPHHLLRPYPSLADAMKSSDVYGYIADLRGTYPSDEAEKLLAALQGDKGPASEPSGPGSTTPHPPLPELPTPAAVLGGSASAERGSLFAPDSHGDPSSETAEEPPLFASLRQGGEPPPRKAPLPHHPSAPAPSTLSPAVEENEAEDRAGGIGVLFSDALFVLLLVVGVVLAGYTLARPFLPLPDAPLR